MDAKVGIMDDKVRIAGIVKESIVDGPGLRLVVFAQGCRHNCPGCHNPETHSFDGGYIISIESILKCVRENPLLDGITLSGGEPFEQAGSFAELARLVKLMGLSVMTYSGYTYEEISAKAADRPDWKKLLDQTDILVDGRFELKNRSLELRFRGSTNQRIIDVVRTKSENRIVLADI